MNKDLKKVMLGAITLVLFLNFQAFAQDEAPLSDEELKKYAMVMDYADQEKARMQKEYNAMIQAEELMQEGRRFQELKNAGGDAEKLAEIEATETEIAAFDTIQVKYDAMVSTFKESYTGMIKDKEQLGAGLYNRINKALKADEELKARYQAILEGVKAERPEMESVEEGS